ncbi:LuxR C-terminal-related transcriptional regulator [Flavobacterium capsici]|uniref:LuxR C-terminal-related transcriptional regulator n=1 Tax=Flavobacterium capsici TaxID=3075618 RepID=A0AA96EWF4_9FLAO|nr:MULTISPECIES: LuxR C-terminal-related transcriptional regulator [unclassified Flavobacterium]WNM18070.1 LuxR C-terminal-related transcriptional regulator [Flavobacterium sp. PMR2A8]WNM22122.1 LuxR C-terminal-related transcriptional regulator [Flavobacterium sp. PMTSA4]
MAAQNGVLQEDVFELNLHKKLLDIFHVGNFYYFFFDLTNLQFKYLSPEIKNVLGYEAEDMNLDFFMSIIHPDDQATFLNYENANLKFFRNLPADKILKYKISSDYRVINSQGEPIRILQQIVPVQYDDNKNILLTLAVHTDISHLKKNNKSILSYIGLEGEPSYIDVDVEEVFKTSKEIFTKREKEIVGYLINGLQSEAIAQKLFISKLTVDTHRKNILAKTNTKSTIELVVKVISEGLL